MSMMGSSQSVTWHRTYEKIKSKHDAAYRSIEEAISLEEQERQCDAIDKYTEGIVLIDEALEVQVQCLDNPDESWQRAVDMVQKMKRTRAEVLQRINSIQGAPTFVERLQAPPSHDEVTGTENNNVTYGDLAEALKNMDVESLENVPVTVLYTHDNVRLYFISPDGVVTSMREPQQLNICIIESEAESRTSTFLQVGDWVYPLVPGVSPCFRTVYGAFILPDLYSEVPNASIGIILPKDADASVYDLLESILHGIVGQPPPEEEPEPRAGRLRRELIVPAEEPAGISGTISRGIMNGANMISNGLIRTAEKASEFLNYGTPKIIGAIEPRPTPKPIPSTVRKGLYVAQTATSAAASATGYLTGKVGEATVALGRYLAPHIQRQGTKLLSKGFALSEEEASKNMDGVLNVAAGAVQGFSTVYLSLETSASILGQSLASNTVNVVEHKYGQPAGEVVGSAFGTAGNIYSLSHNVRHLMPKGLVKTAAKETTKAVICDGVRHSICNPSGPSSSMSLPEKNEK